MFSPCFGEDTEKLAILRKIRQDFCLDSAHAAQLQRNLGGALKRLGEDLYREQHHFVFELLQNGDDNKYPEKEIPCYKLILCHLESFWGCFSFWGGTAPGRTPRPEAKTCWLHSPTKLALNRRLEMVDVGSQWGRV